MAKQLSFYDLRAPTSEPVLEDPSLRGAVVREEAVSVREMTDGIVGAGAQWSGQQRHNVALEVGEALWRLHVHAWAILGSERDSAVLLLRVCSRDQRFDPPQWLRELWLEYREELREVFHDADAGRETDYSEGGDE